MRNHGVCLGYAVVGYRSLIKGLDKISPNYDTIFNDLENVYYYSNILIALGSISFIIYLRF